MRWIITISLNATDDATAEQIEAFVNDAIAEESGRANEDGELAWDGIFGNAQAVADYA